MFSILYNASMHVYQAGMQLAASFHDKARLAVTGRRDWRRNLRAQLADNRSPIVWFHAASLGEFEQGRPVIEEFRQQYPAYKILLTFFSPSGYEVRKTYAGADYIAYLPLDTPANARDFLELVQPKLALFIKYEFWYNYLRELSTRRIPVLAFSVIFQPGQVLFRPYAGFYQRFLFYVNHFLVQNQTSVALLEGIGVTNVTLAGDTRFDRVRQVAEQKKDIPVARQFKDEQPLLVVGSAWQADMDVLIPFLNQFDQPLKVIIAPHEIHETQIESWRKALNGPSVRFSETRNADFPAVRLPAARYLIIDNVGMLSSLYQYGEFAYIGGAFGKGLHNTLEAATFGLPLFFGPTYDKFQEAIDLVEQKAAFPINNAAELETAFWRLYEDAAARTKASATARDYVVHNTGATAKVMAVIQNVLH